jgi:uncharacterized protein (DUF2252 family)
MAESSTPTIAPDSLRSSGPLAPPDLPVAERRARGSALRAQIPRGSHAGWIPPADRPDPIALLESEALNRVPELVPIRYGRMLASPFAFLRGAAILMAADLATTPSTGIVVQLCGDAHLANFGLYASPERRLLFDANDFDQTLPGPWEWDVKRLAASIMVAGRTDGIGEAAARDAVHEAVHSYRARMAAFASMGEQAVWYARVRAATFVADQSRTLIKRRAQTTIAKARQHDHHQSLAKLTEVVNGRRRIVNDPPLIERVETDDLATWVQTTLDAYRQTLQDDRRHLLARYRFVDLARKVVGVGSVGMRCYIVLLTGRDDDDPLFLQIKQAERSVLEAHLPPSRYANHGQRVVAGQRLMQAASDILLGWQRGSDGRDYYWRQLRDMKGGANVAAMTASMLRSYAALCGWALARGHARSGDHVQIAAYLGRSDQFDRAIAAFATAYADQTERDHAALVAAVRSGRVAAEIGI